MMRVLCVDDALPIMEDVVAMCRQLPQARQRCQLYPKRGQNPARCD